MSGWRSKVFARRFLIFATDSPICSNVINHGRGTDQNEDVITGLRAEEKGGASWRWLRRFLRRPAALFLGDRADCCRETLRSGTAWRRDFPRRPLAWLRRALLHRRGRSWLEKRSEKRRASLKDDRRRILTVRMIRYQEESSALAFFSSSATAFRPWRSLHHSK